MLEIATFSVYFFLLLLVAFLSYQKQRSDTDYVLGNRSLNFWLTALSAHASDMSAWLFLAYPAMIFTQGVFGAWAAIGLLTGMFLNWQFIAPKLRIATEQSNSLTLNSYFETRFGDTSGSIRLISAAMSILFLTFYISSGLVALGHLLESLLHISYTAGIGIGLCIAVLYIFLGGYRTIAWIDLFQGFFLLAVILLIPILLFHRLGGFTPVAAALSANHLSSSLFPDFRAMTLLDLFLNAAGWGLGYFGMPHILTKFMGIRKVSEMKKAQWLGISWQFVALASATVAGLFCIAFFLQGVSDPEQVMVNIVKVTLPPFFAVLVTCAVLAATTNVMAAQILVVASNLSEDIYKRTFRHAASPTELLLVSRIGVLLIACVGFVIAYFQVASIYELVFYSWSGLGASFGPLLLASLYRKSITRLGALFGILVGGLTAAILPYFHLSIPPLVAGFLLSFLAIEGVSRLWPQKLSEKS